MAEFSVDPIRSVLEKHKNWSNIAARADNPDYLEVEHALVELDKLRAENAEMREALESHLTKGENMESNEYGLALKIAGVGVVDNHPAGKNLRALNAYARRAVRNPEVISACVYDKRGIARLYLKKTETGLLREERTPNSLLTLQ
jgi:hypothetical protein